MVDIKSNSFAAHASLKILCFNHKINLSLLCNHSIIITEPSLVEPEYFNHPAMHGSVQLTSKG